MSRSTTIETSILQSGVGSERFRRCLAFIISEHEGGYADDVRDPGGKTRWGVTEGVARSEGYQGEIAELPLNTAVQIYWRSWWLKQNLDKVQSYAVACEIMDTSINVGRRGAGLVTQDAVNLIYRRELHQPITRDGAIGPETVGALNRLTSLDHLALLAALNGFQFKRYLDVIKNKPQLIYAIRAWLRRTLTYSMAIRLQ